MNDVCDLVMSMSSSICLVGVPPNFKQRFKINLSNKSESRQSANGGNTKRGGSDKD